MWRYNNTEELYHYGVLGMKWGKRTDRKVSNAEQNVKRLTEKRDNIQQKKGAATKAYINTSKDLLYAKGKLKYESGKRDKNSSQKIIGKDMMSEAKMLKKPDSALIFGFNNKKNLYPSKLSKEDKQAINYMEYNRAAAYNKRKRLAQPISAIAGSAALTIGTAYVSQMLLNKGTRPLNTFV